MTPHYLADKNTPSDLFFAERVAYHIPLQVDFANFYRHERLRFAKKQGGYSRVTQATVKNGPKQDPPTPPFLFCTHLSLLLSSFSTSRGHRGVVPLLPPGSSLQFLSRIGFFGNPTARPIFIVRVLLLQVAHALARFPQVNLCTTRKSPYELIRVLCTRGGSNLQN